MGMPVEAFDLTAGFKALDSDWNAAFGKAVAETVETTARRAGEATRDVAAEAAAPADDLPSGRRAEAMTAETVASVADVVEKVARTATKAAEPVRKATIAAKPAKPAEIGKPVAMAKPEQPDDLKQIAGIGPKLEEVLNRLGIWSFAQIAGWGEAEIAWVDDYLQARGRIGRDGWIDQAKALTKK
jgi:NADH-quinone oxidoreductase subunit E